MERMERMGNGCISSRSHTETRFHKIADYWKISALCVLRRFSVRSLHIPILPTVVRLPNP